MNKTARWDWAMALAALLVALPSHALYKVVGPDGKVTYTDTPPPPNSGSKVTRLTGSSASVVSEPALPLELRQAMQRYPVTLYALKVCEPCDLARQTLRQRGVPFAEKLIVTRQDEEELMRISGGRDAPTVTIGAQVLRGFAGETLNSYLDSAGYPRDSRLPASYQAPPATPLTESPAVTRRQGTPVPPPAAPVEQQPPAVQPSPSGIRF
ncbi:glutaredoxin domain-containing protein [Piscinibacter sp. XHJ-5]|uniref:glutaredoxin domain-containing protein n=1 Tax=Piscinibacter sp. XHJ-5 TaxID=3037797 RepID=UPI002452BF53|nr:glutaredoxin domain-containing protein [Piscinibacter sp. XHJ-5]